MGVSTVVGRGMADREQAAYGSFISNTWRQLTFDLTLGQWPSVTVEVS